MTAATKEAPQKPWKTQVDQDLLAGHQWTETPDDPSDAYVFDPVEMHFPGSDLVPGYQDKRATEEPLTRLYEKAKAVDVIPVDELSVVQRAGKWLRNFRRRSGAGDPSHSTRQSAPADSTEVDVYAARATKEAELAAKREEKDRHGGQLKHKRYNGPRHLKKDANPGLGAEDSSHIPRHSRQHNERRQRVDALRTAANEFSQRVRESNRRRNIAHQAGASVVPEGLPVGYPLRHFPGASVNQLRNGNDLSALGDPRKPNP